MSVEKTLNTILLKLENVESKVDNLDSRIDKLDGRMDSLDNRMNKLDSRMDSLEVNLANFKGEFNNFRNETNETLSRIEKRANATFEQVGGLSEYRTSTKNQLDNIESDMSYYSRKQIENEKEIYKLERKIAK